MKLSPLLTDRLEATKSSKTKDRPESMRIGREREYFDSRDPHDFFDMCADNLAHQFRQLIPSFRLLFPRPIMFSEVV